MQMKREISLFYYLIVYGSVIERRESIPLNKENNYILIVGRKISVRNIKLYHLVNVKVLLVIF